MTLADLFFVPSIDHIQPDWLPIEQYELDVLRLDLMDPEISGNKYFKLRYYLDAFPSSGKLAIATFGGTYSNHIAATAAACHRLNIPCIGIIRGEENTQPNPTLELAARYGMQLQYVSREAYKNKENIIAQHAAYYWVDEGGSGDLGVQGAGTIWEYIPNGDKYTHIIVAVGTGTTIAGLIINAPSKTKIIGINVLKGYPKLAGEIIEMTMQHPNSENFTLNNDFHFGGYAHKQDSLLEFMNDFWKQTHIPTDFVYTGKVAFATKQLIIEHVIPSNAKILMIHTGGLQGNSSLSHQDLHFL